MKTNNKAIQFLSRLLLTFALVALGLTSPGTTAAKPPTGSTCDGVSVNLFLRDAMGDSVTSDGGHYAAVLNCNLNNLNMATEAGRGVVFQLTNPSDGGTFTLSTGGPVYTNLGASIADDGGILGLAVGETATTTKVQFNFVLGSKRYFLSWGSNYPGASTAVVTHPDADTWVIETSAQPNNVARLRECPAHGACKSPVDRYYFAPIRMDLFRAQ